MRGSRLDKNKTQMLISRLVQKEQGLVDNRHNRSFIDNKPLPSHPILHMRKALSSCECYLAAANKWLLLKSLETPDMRT
jgi:hypothetical protein